MSSTPLQSEDFKLVHASSIFEGIAAELERVRALGFHVEGSICRLAGPIGLQAEFVEDLQQFDLMLQQIAALRDLMAGLARLPGAEALMEIGHVIDAVTLKDLKSRLMGELVVADGSGDVDFFESDAA